jgi:deoxyxylulose-5-phosphate synthase
MDIPLTEGSVRWHQKASEPRLIVVALGSAAVRAKEAVLKLAQDGQNVTLVSSIDAKPIPSSILTYLFQHPNTPLLTVEDGASHGGFGSTVVSSLSGRTAPWDIAGYGDHFIPHGTPAGLEAIEKLTQNELAQRMRKLMG